MAPGGYAWLRPRLPSVVGCEGCSLGVGLWPERASRARRLSAGAIAGIAIARLDRWTRHLVTHVAARRCLWRPLQATSMALRLGCVVRQGSC